MTARTVCVLGGSGFVGTRFCAALAAGGWQVTVPSRKPMQAPQLAVLPTVRVVAADLRAPGRLEALFSGQQAVVNLIGILNEGGRDGSGFREIHAGLARRVVAACRAAKVGRLLQMSALRADADHGPSHYLRSKGMAERIIREESGPDLGWTIFQPSVIFGADDSFLNRFAGLLQLVPLGLPLARPGARFAPVWVDDVVAALVRTLPDDATAGESYQLCGPEQYTLIELVRRVRDELGLHRAIVGLPDWAARLQAAICDFVPGKPFSTDNYRSLTVDSVCSSNGFARLGIRPQPLSTLLPRLLGPARPELRLARYRKRAGR
ncbi:MAG: complex I NDUFA9 subunit family protein [Gammaproteobacteria bacterium]|nr:MAG: complex I NDUFA9 subunit family protein [Gammaproteobacteria bacterium]